MVVSSFSFLAQVFLTFWGTWGTHSGIGAPRGRHNLPSEQATTPAPDAAASPLIQARNVQAHSIDRIDVREKVDMPPTQDMPPFPARFAYLELTAAYGFSFQSWHSFKIWLLGDFGGFCCITNAAPKKPNEAEEGHYLTDRD